MFGLFLFLFLMRTLVFLTSILTSSTVDVEKILSSMTLREKIGQLAQYDIAAFWDSKSKSIDWGKVAAWQREYHFGSMLNSVFSGGSIDGKIGWNASEWRAFIHQLQEVTESSQTNATKVPLIFGIDSIHGGTFIYGSTLFPQAINLAATFNRTHAYIQGAITGKDTRAAAIPWIFAPVLGLALTPAWARFPETFGEDPYLAAEMGANVIRGIQTVVKDGGIPRQAAACMKHFIAYSDPVNGHDRSPVMLPDRVLQQLYRPSFQAAIDAGVMTAMESYNEVGGIPMVSSKAYLQTLLRSPWRMNFTGMMVTDYQEILNLNYWHDVAASERDALELALTDTSIDMSMIPFNENFVDQLEELVKLGKVPESRIDASARRILELKDDLGLFETFVPDIIDPLVDTVGSDSDWATSLQSARDSITLLKNNQNILPLSKTLKVFLTGPTCDSLVSQSGGWTFHWQGASANEEFTKGSTIKSSLYSLVGQQMSYAPGPKIDDTDLSSVNITEALIMADNADYTVACIGEGTYAEKPGDIEDLSLAEGQRIYVETLAQIGTPIILILIEGRPRLLNGLAELSSAVVIAYQPGPLGGTAVVDVLYGATSPAGVLPFNYPKRQANIPYTYHRKPSDMCVDSTNKFLYIPCQVEWAFGTSLSYTTFAYSDLSVHPAVVDENGAITVSLTVTNTGNIDSLHTVLVFLFDSYRRVSPEYKLLRRFEKIFLAAGVSSKITWSIPASELEFVGVDSWLILENGNFFVGIGADVDCRKNPTSSNCASFELSTSPSYNKVCSAACSIWQRGVCNQSVNYELCNKTCSEQAWSWDYVNCLESFAMGFGVCVNGNPQCYNPFVSSVDPIPSEDVPEECSSDSSTLIIAAVICSIGGTLLGVVGTFFYSKNYENSLLKSGWQDENTAKLLSSSSS